MSPLWSRVWDGVLIVITMLAVFRLVSFIRSDVGMSEVVHVFGLGLITLTRVMLLIGLASLVWVPISVWIGLRPQ